MLFLDVLMVSEIQEQQNPKEAIYLKHINRHHKLPVLIMDMFGDTSSITDIKRNEELDQLHRRDQWLTWHKPLA